MEERKGSFTPSIGQSEFEVSFSPALPDTNYEVFVTMVCLETNSKAMYFQSAYNKTTSSFFVKLSGPIPSSNYRIDWHIVKS